MYAIRSYYERVFITEEGYRVLDHIAGVGEQLDRIVFENVSDAELKTASGVIERVKDNIRECLRDPPIV